MLNMGYFGLLNANINTKCIFLYLLLSIKKRAKKHKTLDLVGIFEELFLIENMKCGLDFNKNNTKKACLCEIVLLIIFLLF